MGSIREGAIVHGAKRYPNSDFNVYVEDLQHSQN